MCLDNNMDEECGSDEDMREHSEYNLTDFMKRCDVVVRREHTQFPDHVG